MSTVSFVNASQECDGYFPTLPVKTELQETNFYISSFERVQVSSQKEIVELTVKDAPKIACSMFYHGSESKENCPDWIESLDKSKPVVIFCHGFNSWRNQMLLLHLAASVAEDLNCHTLRFDFTGNGHSGGQWSGSNFNGEVDDLRHVVNYVHSHIGCRVASILGHSKGSLAVMRYVLNEDIKARTNNKPVTIPCAINLSGRFMTPCSAEEMLDKMCNEEQKAALKKNGVYNISYQGTRERKCTMNDIKQRAKIDMSCVKDIHTSWILSIHGDKDNVVSMYDAYNFAAVLPNNELRFIKGADHNFNGLKHIQTMTAIITDFVTRRGGFSAVTQNEAAQQHWLTSFEQDCYIPKVNIF